MSRTWKAALGIVGVVAVLWLISEWSWSRAGKNSEALEPPPQRPTQVRWVRATRADINDWIYGEGAARAVRRVHLAFEVEERVVELGITPDGHQLREGMEVAGPQDGKKGQLIARLDDADFSEELSIARSAKLSADRDVDVARAMLKQSETRAALEQTRLTRIKRLHSRGNAADEEFNEARAELELAQAAVESARAQARAAEASSASAADSVAQAERNFERTRLHAPWSGTIGRLNVRVGDYATAGALDNSDDDAMAATFPVTLVDTSSFEVSVEVPAYRMAELRPGNQAYVQRQNASPSDPTTRDEAWHAAEVVSVAPILSPKSRTVRVKIQTRGADLQLLDGELLRTKILRSRRSATVVPVNAIVHRNNEAWIFVCDPGSLVVEAQVVETGVRENSRVEIRGGLSSGDIVVTEGRQRLVAGDVVRLLDPPLGGEGVSDE